MVVALIPNPPIAPAFAVIVPVMLASVAVNTPVLVTLNTDEAPSANPSVPKYNPVLVSVNVDLEPNVILGVVGSNNMLVADKVVLKFQSPILPPVNNTFDPLTSPAGVTWKAEDDIK